MATERLTLVAQTPGLAQVALENGAKLEQMLGARVPEAWPGAEGATMLPRIARGVEQTGVEPTRLIVLHGGQEPYRERPDFMARPTDLGR